jgi:hypothetical protein
MIEEYIFPGGYSTFLKRINPRIAPRITRSIVVVINSLQIALCIVVILVGRANLTFSMSLAGLLFLNSLLHIGASMRVKGYAPGVVTGILLYLPLSLYAYAYFGSTGQLNMVEGAISFGLGFLFQAIPIAYFALSSVINR